MKKKNEFDEYLLKAIDEGLTRILTETATVIIYRYLENHYSLKRKEIPQKLDVFNEGLQRFLGSGATVIEGEILKNLYSSLGLQFKQIKRGHSFLDHIEKLKSRIVVQLI